MPFDNQETDDLMTFTPGREGLRKLAKLLRMQMPPKFRWDFRTVGSYGDACGTSGCAIGLARYFWPEARKLMPGNAPRWSFEVAEAFAMPESEAVRIFFGTSLYGKADGEMNRVTATDVANEIERYLST